MLPNFTYVRPATVAEAGQALAAKGARALAGGTDLVGCLRDHVLSAEHRREPHRARRAERHRRRRPTAACGSAPSRPSRRSRRTSSSGTRYAALAQAAGAVASPQLRNQGTIGGNLCQKPRCWYYRGDFACLRKGGDTCYAPGGENVYHGIFGGGPCFYVHPSDPAPALVALGASVGVAGPAGRAPGRARAVLRVCRPTTCLRETVARAGRGRDRGPAAAAGGRPERARTARCARGRPGTSRWWAPPWRSAWPADAWPRPGSC